MGRAVWSLQTAEAEAEGTERRSKWRKSGVRRVGGVILLGGAENETGDPRRVGMNAKDDVRGPKKKCGSVRRKQIKESRDLQD